MQHKPTAFFSERLLHDSFIGAEVYFRFSIAIIPSAAASNCSDCQTHNIIHTNAETKAAIGQEKPDERLFAMSFVALTEGALETRGEEENKSVVVEPGAAEETGAGAVVAGSVQPSSMLTFQEAKGGLKLSVLHTPLTKF